MGALWSFQLIHQFIAAVTKKIMSEFSSFLRVFVEINFESKSSGRKRETKIN